MTKDFLHAEPRRRGGQRVQAMRRRAVSADNSAALRGSAPPRDKSTEETELAVSLEQRLLERIFRQHLDAGVGDQDLLFQLHAFAAAFTAGVTLDAQGHAGLE